MRVLSALNGASVGAHFFGRKFTQDGVEFSMLVARKIATDRWDYRVNYRHSAHAPHAGDTNPQAIASVYKNSECWVIM